MCAFKSLQNRAFKEIATFTGGRNRLNNELKDKLNCFFKSCGWYQRSSDKHFAQLLCKSSQKYL